MTPRHRHSPLARRLARTAGVDLDGLMGTGPGGRVTRADIAAAAAPVRQVQVCEPPPATPAQLTCVIEVDVSGIVRLRRDEADNGVPLSLTAFFVAAAAHALRACPQFNASIDTDAGHHIGIAVVTDKGLVVPVIRDAADLNLRGLNRRIDELARSARAGTLTPDDLSAGTFTVADTGSWGVLFETAILAPGQVGILGIGAVVGRPVVVQRSGGERALAIRDMAHLALTYDHRLVDGADAARLLTLIRARLEVDRPDVEPR